MPREEVINAIRQEIKARDLPAEAGERIIAFLKRAEGGDFPNRDQDEQLSLILEALPGLAANQEGPQI